MALVLTILVALGLTTFELSRRHMKKKPATVRVRVKTDRR